MPELKAGARLKSAVCTTEVIVVRAADGDLDLRCGGQPMTLVGDEAAQVQAIDPTQQDGTQLGKRYADPSTGLELLCTKGGDGSLALGDELITKRDAKPLPSSD